MPVTVIIGGQYGSEGKGKVAYEIAKTKRAKVAVRVGGTNSGHTVIDPIKGKIIFRQLPTASLLPGVKCVLPAGSYIDIDILLAEINLAGLTPDRLVIDPYAMIINEEDYLEERKYLTSSIGSTGSGTGSAVIRRIERKKNVKLAKDIPTLQKYIFSAPEFMENILKKGDRIIVEGTQGFGLSLLHSHYYPFVTSRDTTAAAFISEAGLSPIDVDEIVLTIRSFPIRVGGNSGRLQNEIDWKIISKESGSNENIIEFTSVTKKIRRIARFDPEIVKQAILVNKPTSIVMNHLDYIDIECYNSNRLTDKAAHYKNTIERLIDRSINLYGFSPSSLIQREDFVNV